MDKIYVSDEALRNSATALQQLADQSARITALCIDRLNAQLSELDTDFRRYIERYIDDIKKLDRKLNDCVQENISALRDRNVKLTEYETHNYIKRTIG